MKPSHRTCLLLTFLFIQSVLPSHEQIIFLASNNATSYNDAHDKCEQDGGILASFDSKQKEELLKNVFEPDDSKYI